MGFSMDVSVPVLTVFVQGLLSFFSPCVLPLLPLYIGYLSGGTAVKKEDGRMQYRRGKVMLHTVFFVIGVSFAFFVLGLGVSAVGTFFKSNQAMFARIGGIVVILFGLYQLRVFGFSQTLERERRLPFRLDKFAMSPLTALLLGFTFSFAWTPCVGPALTSVLLMAASASTRLAGFVLIGVYTLGFVLPFLAVGLFTTTLLELFRKHQQVVRYTVKIGGVLMVLMGIFMFTGTMNNVTGYLSRISDIPGVEQEETSEKNAGEEAGGGTSGDEADVESDTGTDDINSEDDTSAGTAATDEETAPGKEPDGHQNNGDSSGEENGAEDAVGEVVPAVDFALTDQYGETHRLEDYKGKTIFLNFWATWCPPCKAEMPDIQEIYETYDTEGEDALVVLGVATPSMGQEGTEEEIKAFLEENGYTYPVLMDTEGELFGAYGVYSLPTTFMIDREGNVFGYVSGMLTKDMMENIIQQTMEGK